MLIRLSIDDTLVSNLKKNVKITKIKGSKVKFEYKKKKYTAKKMETSIYLIQKYSSVFNGTFLVWKFNNTTRQWTRFVVFY